MIIVSHDRWFLDRVITKVFELHGRRITVLSRQFQAILFACARNATNSDARIRSAKEYIEKQEE